MRQIVSEMTAGLGQGLENSSQKVESQPESIRKKTGKTATKTRAQEIPDTTDKQLKDRKESIENSMEDVEMAERELGKERHQMDDLEKVQEEPKLSFEKSSDCNINTVSNETARGESELAADRAPEENMGYLDRAKSEGKFPIRISLGTICLRLTEDIFS